jgi:CRP/FNR family cyclic AMP-dependent transcriptional regulator
MDLPKISVDLLANAGSPPVSFAPGEEIFRQGEKGDKMYVVCSGEIDIELNGKVIETIGEGGTFGEMALIDGSPRAATARAKNACEVAPINDKTFVVLVGDMPFFALWVMRSLVYRLRRMDTLVGA